MRWSYHPQEHPSEAETTVCDVNEQTGQCEFTPPEGEEGEDKERGEVKEGTSRENGDGGEGADTERGEAKEGTEEGTTTEVTEKRYFQIPQGSATVIGSTCPIDPDMKVCLLVSELL